jgi:putative CocE/NonD family hydrolase
LIAVTALCAAAPAAGASAGAAWWTEDRAVWSQAYIHEPDGTELHADVLRPADLPAGARVPVILSIGPYFSHAGSLDPSDHYDPQDAAAPSGRYRDFIEGTNLFRRGYAYVMVDLRGFGGSSGCQDNFGPGEQSDVTAAVRWAASQPWSTGRVGMYGKSYDGGTGLVGEAMEPAGLKAIVAMEPVVDQYDVEWTNGVRTPSAVGTPESYDLYSTDTGTLTDSAEYKLNALSDLELWQSCQDCEDAPALLRLADRRATRSLTGQERLTYVVGSSDAL